MRPKYEKPRQQDLNDLMMAVGACSSGSGVTIGRICSTGGNAKQTCTNGQGFGEVCVGGNDATTCSSLGNSASTA